MTQQKKTSVTLSTTEAEYITIGNYGTQILYIIHQLIIFNLFIEFVPIMCDNTNAISLSKYKVHHSRSKHINIKYHFIRDHIESGDFSLQFIDYENHIPNIFTKTLLEERWYYLRKKFGVLSLNGL